LRQKLSKTLIILISILKLARLNTAAEKSRGFGRNLELRRGAISIPNQPRKPSEFPVANGFLTSVVAGP